MTKKYIVGIDLGTTNCTIAYAENSLDNSKSPEISQFNIPQAEKDGMQQALPSLPSFVYFPLKDELNSNIGSIEWNTDKSFCVGAFARDRGSELPNRMVASAKSWLCHDGIDRREKILPLDFDEESISPVEACSEFLRHMKEAWDFSMIDALFAEQTILLTVPASFDPGARQLVQEAAEMAGYPEIMLIEEPMAAFYSWLHKHAETWREGLSVGDNILVVDVGGGTTDFTLITVVDEGGDLSLERVAVGSHLLLGGDNMDLALAYTAKMKLEEQGHDVDDWQLRNLVHMCRKAKETLMGETPPEHVDITINGRGSSIIGGSLTTTLTREEVHAVLVDGFFPLVEAQELSPSERRSGIQQIGLPYAHDARISCQIAKFLSMTGDADDNIMDKFVVPTAVLLNGGAFKGTALRDRLEVLLNTWAEQLGKAPVRVLPHEDLDFAVSSGAVYYGFARTGNAVRIRGGTSRSYFIGVEDAIPAVPGIPIPMRAVCVVPYGMEEGTEEKLDGKEFALVVGEQTTFRFFSRSTQEMSDGTEPRVGMAIRSWKRDLTELHPIETVLERGPVDGKTIRVTLTSKVTELGVLELWCVSNDGRKWKLEFDLRK